MLEFINEPVGVEIQRRPDGTERPQAFTWRGQYYPITAWGRVRESETDGRLQRCHLLQTAGAETWELCRDAETGQWTLTRRWTRPGRII